MAAAKARATRARNPGKAAIACRRWYRKNVEKKAKARAWQKANPEKVREWESPVAFEQSRQECEAKSRVAEEASKEFYEVFRRTTAQRRYVQTHYKLENPH